MTRAEVLESLQPYPENILRARDGVVKFSHLMEWIRRCMTVGSNQKVWEMDLKACAAIGQLLFMHPSSFRVTVKMNEAGNAETWLATPYGVAKVILGGEGITCFDEGVKSFLKERPEFAAAQGYAEPIAEVR